MGVNFWESCRTPLVRKRKRCRSVFSKSKVVPNPLNVCLELKCSSLKRSWKKKRLFWKKNVIGSNQRPGRDFNAVGRYGFDSCTTAATAPHFSWGHLFGLDDSCRLIRRPEPLLVQIVNISQKRSLSQEEVES